jgi:hypothetical protein
MLWNLYPTEGGLELHGPAQFANLVVTPGETDGLSPVPLADRARTPYGWGLAMRYDDLQGLTLEP